MNTTRPAPSFVLLALLTAVPAGAAAQSVLVEARTAAGDEVATIRTDSMRLLVPLHLLVGGFSAGYVAVGDSLRVEGEGSFVANGTYVYQSTVPPPTSGAGTRMMWYPERAAFRAGNVSGTQWDLANVGPFSAALGNNTTASSDGSIALGQYTTASGASSTAFGYGTRATFSYSTAGGYTSTASGYASTALGYNASASGYYSTSLGYNTIASANSSTSLGSNTTASGQFSTALGYGTTASGYRSTAMGSFTNAQAYGSVAIGSLNVVQGSATGWVTTDPLFVAGNGSSTPSNALTLYKNGNLTIAGTLTQSSDARLKEDIEPLEGTLERVLHLTPIRYHFRAGTGRPEGTQLGLTAQEVQPLFPELVKQDGDGYLSLSYANLSAVLVKAVQEQQAEIEPLQARIETLRTRTLRQDEAIAALRRRNERLEAELAALREERGTAEARVARLEALVEKLVSARAMFQSHPDDPQDPR